MDGFTGGKNYDNFELYILVYYLHFTDTMEEQSHSFPLAHSLTPGKGLTRIMQYE